MKERIGMVASLEVIDRGLVWVLRELGLKVKVVKIRILRRIVRGR